MKLKYMIRGLGLGIIITAVVMGAYSRNAVANARVAVLREYGLGEENRLVEETESSTESISEESSVAESTEPVIVRDEEKESEIQSVLDAAKEGETHITASEEQSAAESSDSGNDSDNTASEALSEAAMAPSDGEAVVGEVIEIVIAPGDDSGTISRKLYNAGLIENASEYDAFLMQHNYDKRLSTGTKRISQTDTWQEIAEKLTSQ